VKRDMLAKLVLVEGNGEVAGGKRVLPADRPRLERMFVDHHMVVWRTLRRRGLDPDAAADATQQTYVVAAERLADIHLDSERAFLVGTALRVARSLGRKTVRWQLDEDMDQRTADAPSALDGQTAVQLCDLALSRVDPDLAEVFVLYELEGLSSPEIAALLEIPLGTVASRLRRAREQFRAVVRRLELAMQREGTPREGQA
jgi:RNA polymerase sigma-70 factor, ECF subfamily